MEKTLQIFARFLSPFPRGVKSCTVAECFARRRHRNNWAKIRGGNRASNSVPVEGRWKTNHARKKPATFDTTCQANVYISLCCDFVFICEMHPATLQFSKGPVTTL